MAEKKKIELNFCGGGYTSRSLPENAQICQNFYPCVDQQGGKSVMTLQNTPGMKAIGHIEYGTLTPADVGTGIRGLISVVDYQNLPAIIVGEALYGVVGNRFFYTVYSSDPLVPTIFYPRSSLTMDTSTGPVQMASGFPIAGSSEEVVMWIDGTAGYYYRATALYKITDLNFPVPESLTYQDGYFIVTEKGSNRIWISSIDNPALWDGNDYGSAEGNPDPAIRIMSINRALWIFGSHSTEIFLNTGNADFPFERMSGGYVDIGCGAKESVASDRGTGCFLDDRYQVRQIEGFQAKVVSTSQIDYQISQLATKIDAIGFMYTQEGHTLYELTFPTDSKTFVYDVSTGFWHTRSTGLAGLRHAANAYAFCYGKHIVGRIDTNDLFSLDYDYYKDDPTWDDSANGIYEVIKAIRVSQPVHLERKRIFHHSLEIDFEMGVGLVVGQGADPQAILQWSDDGGHSWSNEHWASIGQIGEFRGRAVWRRLGQSRSRLYKLTIVDPVKRVIIGAFLEATIEDN